MDEPSHPLCKLLREAAYGRYPEPSGQVEVMEAPPGHAQGVVSFTAHNVVATSIPRDEVREHLPTGDFGAPMRLPFLAWLSQRLGQTPGLTCIVLARIGQPAVSPIALLDAPPKMTQHPRVTRSLRFREEVRTYTDADGQGLVLLGKGLARRWEIGIELEPDQRGRGRGKAMVAAAVALLPPSEPVFAQIPVGNARSVRTFLALGFHPIGGEVLFSH